jgi:biotin carboxylase
LVILIAPARSYRVRSYIDAAARIGARLLIVSDSPHSLVAEIAAGINVDFSDQPTAIESILDAVSGADVKAVLATDDSVSELSSRIAARLGLAHNAPDAALLTYRKDLARARLKEAGCNVPLFSIVALRDAAAQADSQPYPVVLKPLMLSGSRGVIRANNAAEFVTAARQIADIVGTHPGKAFESSHCLVEEFIAGREIAFDAYLRDGELIPLVLFDKPEALDGPFFEESYYLAPSILPEAVQQQIREEVERCCQAYGLHHGPIHAEARISDKGIYLIEIAARTIGGQCGQLIDYIMDARLEEIVLHLATSDENAITMAENRYAGVLMIPIPSVGILRRVEGMIEAQNVEHIRQIDIHIQPGYELVPLPHGESYLGFIFADSTSYQATYRALKEAHEKLHFVTSELIPLEVARV